MYEIIVREQRSRALLSCKIVARKIDEIRVVEGRLDTALFDAYAGMCGKNWGDSRPLTWRRNPSPRREPDMPSDLLRALFGNVISTWRTAFRSRSSRDA